MFYSSEAKQEQQNTELTSENLSSLIRSEMHTQKNKPKTAAVSLQKTAETRATEPQPNMETWFLCLKEPSQTETKLSLEASASFGYQPSRETPAGEQMTLHAHPELLISESHRFLAFLSLMLFCL